MQLYWAEKLATTPRNTGGWNIRCISGCSKSRWIRCIVVKQQNKVADATVWGEKEGKSLWMQVAVDKQIKVGMVTVAAPCLAAACVMDAKRK